MACALERRVSSSLAALLLAAVPFTAVAIAAATGGERFGSRRIAGLLVGIGGVAAIVGLDIRHTSGIGIAEMAVVVLGYATGPWSLSRYLSDLPSLGVIAASLTVTTILYAPAAALQLPSSLPSGRVLASIAGLAVLCTAIAFLLFFELIAEVGPVRSMVFTYINPAVAALVGVAVLNERFTAGMGVGFALVLAGSVLATGSTRQPALAEP